MPGGVLALARLSSPGCAFVLTAMRGLRREPATPRLEPVGFARSRRLERRTTTRAAFAAFRAQLRAIAARPSRPLRPARPPDPDLAAGLPGGARGERSRARGGARASSSAHFGPSGSLRRRATASSPAITSRNSTAPGSGRSRFRCRSSAGPTISSPSRRARPCRASTRPCRRRAARADGGFEPYPDRAAIEDGALGARARPDRASARARRGLHHPCPGLRPHPPRRRLGRCASPMRAATAIPTRRSAASWSRSGDIPLAEMSLERLMGWLRAHPDEARALMRRNRSYIFFREADGARPGGRPDRRRRRAAHRRPQPRGRPHALVLRPAVLARGRAAASLGTGRAPAPADDRPGYRLGDRRAGPGRFLRRQRPRGRHPGRASCATRRASSSCCRSRDAAMTKPRRYRSLQPEERRLWAQVARGVTPLRGPRLPARAGPAEPARRRVAAADPRRVPAPVPAAFRRLPPLAPIERKTLLALRRGSSAVDARHRPARHAPGRGARGAASASCAARRRAGHGVVLVVTGKGGAGAGGSPVRGARRAAPGRAALAAPARPALPRARLRGGLPPSRRLRCTLCPAPPPAGRRAGSMTPFGERVRRLRRERGLLLKDMAAHLGVSSAYLSALERGERGKPTWTLIQGVIQYFNIIWDEADELARLADLSDPRVKIDTAGTRPRPPSRQPPRPGDRRRCSDDEIGRILDGARRALERGRRQARRRMRAVERRPAGACRPERAAVRSRLTAGGPDAKAPTSLPAPDSPCPSPHRRAHPRQRHRRRARPDRRRLPRRPEACTRAPCSSSTRPGPRSSTAPWARRRSCPAARAPTRPRASRPSAVRAGFIGKVQGRRDRPPLRPRPQGDRRPLRRRPRRGRARDGAQLHPGDAGRRAHHEHLSRRLPEPHARRRRPRDRAGGRDRLSRRLSVGSARRQGGVPQGGADRPRGRQPGRADAVRRLLRRPLPGRVPGADARRQPRHPVRQHPRAAEPLRHRRRRHGARGPARGGRARRRHPLGRGRPRGDPRGDPRGAGLPGRARGRHDRRRRPLRGRASSPA